MLFVVLPLLLNIGMYITDVVYNEFGWTLTAGGLGNQDWLDFWGAYLSVVIAFIGICLAWKSSAEDRRMDKNEKLVQEYDEKLKEEKNILLEMCQSFNIDVIYKVIDELNNMDIGDCRKILQSSREKVINVQVKFELLSDISDGFQKCEGCDFNPCYDRKNMIVKAINLISQEMKPQIISYCKSYMDWKSRHKKELLLEGQIRYIKYPNCDKEMDLKH